MVDALSPMQESEPKTILGRAKRWRRGLARRFFRYARRIGIGSVLTIGALMGLFPGSAPVAVSLLAIAAFYGLMAAPALWLAGLVARSAGFRREGALGFDEGALTLERDGEVRRLAVSVQSGIMLPKAKGFEVRFQLDGGDEISVFVHDEASANALLDLAGVGREQRRTHVRWARMFNRLASGFAGLTVGSMTLLFLLALLGRTQAPGAVQSAVTLLGFAMPYVLAGASSRLFAWRELVVGTDGVSWKRNGRRHFVPLREIDGVMVHQGSLVLTRDDGSKTWIRVDADDPGLADALNGRIRKALAEVGRAGGKLTLFTRGDRSFDDWMASVRDLLKKGRGFRDIAVHAEDALAVLTDPAADPESRVGAALALERTEEPALIAKVRVAADACASPKLRVALEDALTGELEEETVEAAQDERSAR